MLKTNLTQICLLNGSLEEFNKYIYSKHSGPGIMEAKCTKHKFIYLPNDSRERPG